MHCKSIVIYVFVILCSELSSKLQDTLEMIEEQLDQALAKTCNNFDIEYYEKVQTAYQLLGKTQVHFTFTPHLTKGPSRIFPCRPKTKKKVTKAI